MSHLVYRGFVIQWLILSESEPHKLLISLIFYSWKNEILKFEQRKAVKITQKEGMGRYTSVAHKQAKKSQDNRFEVVLTPINRGSWSNHDGDARSIKRMDL